MSYANEEDVKQIIGGLPISEDFSIDSFLRSALSKMHTYMIGLYVVPIKMLDGASESDTTIVSDILNSIQKGLAGGGLLLALGASSENEQLHAYGQYLIDDAVRMLEDIQTQILILPSVEIDLDTTDDKTKFTKIGFSSPDTSSYFNRNYNEVGNPSYPIEGGVV